MQINVRPAAREDLRAIWVFGAERWGEQVADAYFDRLTTAIYRLRDHPHCAAFSPDLGPPYRRLVCAAHLVFYLVEPDRIEVLRVLHQSRDDITPI